MFQSQPLRPKTKQAMQFLMKLSSEFKILRTNILSCKNQPSIDETISDFLSEETHLKYKLIRT